eukprot:jgi/Undpi1/1836/HiC_scaffold_12.g05223.m1
MEVRSRQDAKLVCIKRRHEDMSAGEVLEEDCLVCYVKAVALIRLRGRGRGGKRRRGGRSLFEAALSKIGHHKGRCGAVEVECSPRQMRAKAKELTTLIRDAPMVVAHTGAGLSTAAGIPDFRGQRGVWTLEKQGHPLPEYERCWDNAFPTLGHMALLALVKEGLVHAIISQNVDGLHLRSGIPREKLCELHGNLFMEVCSGCQREVRRTADVGGVGFQKTGRACPHCGEALVDVLLDWEDELRDYEEAVDLSKRCGVRGGVALCLGTSLQIAPSKDLPAKADNMAIVNLQKTPKDARAEIVIHAKIDAVMRCVMQELGVAIPVFRRVETLVVSHTSCRSDKGPRWRWTIAVGDAADGARCGFVESMVVSFPGTKLAEARVTSGPFRVSRATSRPEAPRDNPSGEAEAGGEDGSSFILTAVLRLCFVAAPGYPAPEPQSVEYRMNLSKSEGSQEVPVFLGQVDYNDSSE